MIILEENFKWHLEAFASELFIYYPALVFIVFRDLGQSCTLTSCRRVHTFSRGLDSRCVCRRDRPLLYFSWSTYVWHSQMCGKKHFKTI